uniref:Dirigent protein n=1 Tax=Ascaris lumbricoides TaxID=6252 RepID=A0A0M3HNP0_ASCLU
MNLVEVNRNAPRVELEPLCEAANHPPPGGEVFEAAGDFRGIAFSKPSSALGIFGASATAPAGNEVFEGVCFYQETVFTFFCVNALQRFRIYFQWISNSSNFDFGASSRLNRTASIQ